MKQLQQTELSPEELRILVSKIWSSYIANPSDYYESYKNKKTIAKAKSQCFDYNLTEQAGFLSTIVCDYLEEKCKKRRPIKITTQDGIVQGSYQGIKKVQKGAFSYAETHNEHLLKVEIRQTNNKKYKREIPLKDILAVYPQ